MEPEKNKGGRPVGSTEDPNSISRKQVLADAKLYASMVDDLKAWYRDHKDTMSLDDRLKCLNFLREAVIQGLKFHLAPAKAAAPSPDAGAEFSPEQLYAEIMGRAE